MKTSFVFISVAFFALSYLVLGRASAADGTTASQSAKPESPFACNAFALSPKTRKRHFEELGPALLKLKKSTRELPDGYEFELPADKETYQLSTEWAFQERFVLSSISTCASIEKTAHYGYVSLADPGLRNSSKWSSGSDKQNRPPTFLVRTHSINGAVVLSEAKHLCLTLLVDPDLIRDSSLRSE